MNTATKVLKVCYPGEQTYVRPSEQQLVDWFDGRIRASSNDGAGNSGYSFSPTEVWAFPDGSALRVGYSDAELCGPHDSAL